MNIYVGQSGNKKLVEACMHALQNEPMADSFRFEVKGTSLGEWTLMAEGNADENFFQIQAFFRGFQKAWWISKG